MTTDLTGVPRRPPKAERQGIEPIATVDGVKVFVHHYRPTADDLARYDEWWRGYIARRSQGSEATPSPRD